MPADRKVRCYTMKMPGGGVAFVRGALGPHCCACRQPSSLLCDRRMKDGRTCDAPICADHGLLVAPDKHLCPTHAALWQEQVKKNLEAGAAVYTEQTDLHLKEMDKMA